MYFHNERLWDIPHFSKYAITKDGKVYLKSNIQIVDYALSSKKSGFIIQLLDDNDNLIDIEIKRLLMNTFYGITNLPIKEKYDMCMKKDIHIDGLSYDTSILKTISYPYKDKFTIYNMEYRRIPNSEAWINEDGAVYRYYNDSFARKSYGLEYPYPTVHYRQDKSAHVHRLLGYTFFNVNASDEVVNHVNGNMFDSFVSNLEIVTPQENTIHAIRTGLKHGHVITPGDVHCVCKMLENNATIQDIRNALQWHDVPNGTISRLIYRIVNKKAWCSITDQYSVERYKMHRPTYYRVYSDDRIHVICQYLQSTNLSNTEIAILTSTTPYLVQNIRCGAQYKEIRSQYNIPYEVKIPRYSMAQYEQMLKLKLQGLSLHEIANCTKIPYQSVVAGLNSIIPTRFPELCAKYNYQFRTTIIHLQDDDVHEICKAILNGQSNSEISKRFNVSHQTIADIRKGKNWRNIAIQYGLPNSKYYISPNPRALDPKLKKIIIDELYENIDLSNREIAELIRLKHGSDLGVDQYRVRNIRRQIVDNNDQLKPRELLGTPL